MKSRLSYLLGAAASLTLLLGANMSRAIEEPAYQMLEKWGDVEVREYAPRIRAVTPLKSRDESSGGFRRLADYIFGGNSEDMSIAMTAPVEETLGDAQPVMAFTMPAQYEMETLPQPNDNKVELEAVGARVVAVTRFSGWATSGKVARAERALRDELLARGVKVTGQATLNQYNPPWTPPFMRRNEIMLPIALNGSPEPWR